MTDRFEQLGLLAAPFQVYVGNTWTSLDRVGQKEMRAVIAQVRSTFQQRGVSTYVSLDHFPPGMRGPGAQKRLWTRLREEMALSHLFLLVDAGPSNGAGHELRNADEFLVPVLALVKIGTPRYELWWSRSLHHLGEIPYNTPEEASEGLHRYLENNWEPLRERMRRVQRRRMIGRRGAQLGETIAWLRSNQHPKAWSREDLAAKSGLTTEEVTDLEEKGLLCNPPYAYILALADAFDISQDQLFWPVDQWQYRSYIQNVVEVAREEGWSIDRIEQFRVTAWHQYRDKPLSKAQIRQILREWERFGAR